MLRATHISTFVALLVSVAPSAHAAEAREGVVVQDPHYGEVLFQFYTEDYFTALTHLTAYRKTGRVDDHAEEAELLQGGLMLSWGQHKEAGEIFERLLSEGTDPAVRDRTWFYIGKVRYQRGYLQAAEQALESIEGQLPGPLEAERYNLLARIYMEQQRFDEAEHLYRADLGLNNDLSRPCQHPGNVWALHGLLECLERRGETSETVYVKRQLDPVIARADVEIGSSCFCRTS